VLRVTQVRVGVEVVVGGMLVGRQWGRSGIRGSRFEIRDSRCGRDWGERAVR
jgi:hypothetical protein